MGYKEKRKRAYVGFVDNDTPPTGYDIYVWSCAGCVKGIRWCEENGAAYKVIPNRWEDEGISDKAVEYILDVRLKLLEYVKEGINSYLHSDYDIDEIDTILFVWITQFVASYYDKYINLQAVLGMDYDMECQTCDAKTVRPAIDYYAYESNEIDDFYNEYQYSVLLEYNLKTDYSIKKTLINRKNQGNNTTPVYKTNKSIKSLLKERLFTALRFYSGLIPGDKCVLFSSDLSFDTITNLYFWKCSKGRIVSVFDEYNQECELRKKIAGVQVDEDWRKKESVSLQGDYKDAFFSFIRSRVFIELPVIYLEGHRIINDYINRKYNRILRSKAVIYGAGSLYGNEVYKYMLAHMRRNGTVLYGMQHGGNYGLDRKLLMYDEYRQADYYFTWGWNTNDDCKCRFLPMPSSKLMSRKTVPACTNGEIVYVSYEEPRYFFRFDRLYIKIHKLKEGERFLLTHLNDKAKAKLTIRLYPYDYGWETRRTLDDSIYGLRYDTSTDFYNTMKSASLMVFMDWQTTFIEALSLGIPVMVFRERDFIMKSAEGDLDELYEVGIAYDDWSKLKNSIENVCDSIEKWWNDAKRQEVVRRIRKKYISSLDNGKQRWNEVLSSIVGGK